MEEVHVYVPVLGRLPEIRRGSGIVGGPPDDHGWVLIDYEGKLYGAENLRTFADLVAHAHDRQRTSYPTVARQAVPAYHLLAVGRFAPETGRVQVSNVAALEEWLDESVRLDQLATSRPVGSSR